MNSTIILYYNSLIEKDKNFILDHWVSNSQRNPDAILLYLNTLEKDTIDGFQYVKQALSLTIKVDMSQTSLNMGSGDGVKDLNYVSIQNGNEKIYYYFVISKNWKSANTIELVLSMDTLNTFMYDADYEISPKTLIKRMHKDRYEILSGMYTKEVECSSGVPVEIEFTSSDFAFSSIRDLTYEISPQPYTDVTYSYPKIGNIRYIRFRFTPYSNAKRTIHIYYKVNGVRKIIDLKSEEIVAPVYKQNENILNNTKSLIEWSLYCYCH